MTSGYWEPGDPVALPGSFSIQLFPRCGGSLTNFTLGGIEILNSASDFRRQWGVLSW